MAKLYIKESFQHNGKVYRTNEEGNIGLKISAEKLKAEMALGKVTKVIKGQEVERWVSGILNHCVPADREAKKIILGEEFNEEEKSEGQTDEEEKASIFAEFEKLGKAPDKRLSLPNLRDALKKARIEVGEQKEEEQKELEA